MNVLVVDKNKRWLFHLAQFAPYDQLSLQPLRKTSLLLAHLLRSRDRRPAHSWLRQLRGANPRSRAHS
jgi:hypothetical protein